MKHSLKISFIMLCALLLFSCSQTTQEIEQNYLKKKIANFDPGTHKKYIVVLPGLGCKGCIQEGEYFMQQNIQNKDILFVLTRAESLKLLEQKTEVKLKQHNNIYIYNENYFDLPTDNVIYPLIMELENDQLKGYQFQSPKNGMAFQKLTDSLKNG